MPSKKMSVREARMELDFATFEGGKEKIAEAERQLQEAITRAADKRKAAVKEVPPNDA